VRVTTQRSGAGVPSRWRPAGILGGGSPDAAAILQLFSKKYAFLNIFWHKFLLKTAFFKCLNKALLIQGLLLGARAPCYATERDLKAHYNECRMCNVG